MMLFGLQSANAFTLTCLRGSDFGGDEGCEKLFDGTQGTKWGSWEGWYGGGRLPWTVFKAALPIAATSYELVIANDTPGSPGRNWKKWKIYAGNFESDAAATKDAAGWVLIDQKDEEMDPGTENNTYNVISFNLSDPQTTYYSYYKIVVEELVGGWGQYCQMDEFRFKDYTVDTSGAQQYVDFDYTTGVDADLKDAYASKLVALNAAIATNDPDQIVPAVEDIMPIYTEIVTLREGNFVALDWTACWGDGPGSNLVDKNDYTKWGGNFPEGEGVEHVQYVVFRTPAQQPYFYKLVTGGDTQTQNKRNWKTWKVFGGNFASQAEATRSAEGWVVLDDREDISTDYLPNKNNYPATLKFTNGVSEAYSYYKVEVYASGGSQQQMSEIYLCTQEDFEAIRQPLIDGLAEFAAGLDDLVVEADKVADKETFAAKYETLKTTTDADQLTILYNELVALKDALEKSAAFVAGDNCVALDGSACWGDGHYSQLVDGNINTKWGGGMPDGGAYVIFRAYEAKTFNQYMLVTGNDTGNGGGARNWKTWKIYGVAGKVTDDTAVRDLAGWTLLDSKENIGQDRLPAANFAPAFFNFSEEWAKSYKYFKIEVEAAYNGSAIQMAEYKMLTDDEYAAYRQEYVDSLQKVGQALLEEFAGVTIPEALQAQIVAEATAKITAVTTATADNLLPYFNAALNYITVQAPALVAAAQIEQVDGVYQIATAMQLVSFASLVNAGEVDADAVLVEDIDMTDVAWPAPIGFWGSNQYAYKGHFDGQGHAITNLTYTTVQNFSGLFGVLSTGALVENFSLSGTITNTDYSPLGGVVGFARDDNPTIRNVHSYVDINNSKAGARIGGILGHSNDGSTVNVDRCTYSGTLDGNDAGGSGNYGGIVGYTQNAASTYCNVTNCLFDGELKNTAAQPGSCTFGGMVGYVGANPTIAIKNCLSIGTVQSAVTGQFFGAVKNTKCSIVNSFYQGTYVNGNANGAVALTNQDATLVTDEQLASGFVASKLAPAFRQELGTDAYPVLDATKPVVAEITEAGYATLYLADTDLQVAEGVEAYTGVVEGDKLMLTAVESVIAADEAVVLKGAAGYYMFTPTTDGVKAEANDLLGAAEDIEAAGKYILAKPEGEPVGFYHAATGVIKAGKAYLEVESSGIKAFLFVGDGATGINAVEALSENGAIYNVAGQRLSKMQKGVNIVGGKKVLY